MSASRRLRLRWIPRDDPAGRETEMTLQSTKAHARRLGGTVLVVALSLLGTNIYDLHRAEAASNPFAGLSGSWSGAGTVTLSGGANERIRCRATYVVGNGGSQLQQNLRCASDSFSFELRSDVNHNAGQISGIWNELTRNVGGNVSGRASSGRIQALVDGPAFAASLALTMQGDRQSVLIRSDSTAVTQVSITLNRTSR
jgi:hypothetical protein